jgi:hypothetical protein
VTRLLAFGALKHASFAHSAIYAVLLSVWLLPGLHGAEFVFGMGHGVGWILMSLACIAALRLGRISLRLAVAVAVLGGVGPFFGTAAFLLEERRRAGAGATEGGARVQPAP